MLEYCLKLSNVNVMLSISRLRSLQCYVLIAVIMLSMCLQLRFIQEFYYTVLYLLKQQPYSLQLYLYTHCLAFPEVGSVTVSLLDM